MLTVVSGLAPRGVSGPSHPRMEHCFKTPARGLVTVSAMTGKAKPSRSRYGFDAPRAVMTIALPGVAAAAAVAAGVALGWATGLVVVFAVLFLVDLIVAVTHLYASRIRKHRVWAELLDAVAWRGDERGLDLGCGRGAALIALARRLPWGHVTGFDIWGRIDRSGNAKDVPDRNAFVGRVADHVEVETGDLQYLPFPSESFDVVTSSLVLHSLRSPAHRGQVLENATRVLKPGGRLLIADIRNIDEYKRALERYGFVHLAIHNFGLLACFGIPRLRVLSGSKPTTARRGTVTPICGLPHSTSRPPTT